MEPGFRVFKTKPGPPTEITSELQNGQPKFYLAEEAMLLRKHNELTASFFKSGIVLIINLYPSADEYYMNFRIQVPRTFANKVRGFLGNLDGSRNIDLYRRGETTPLPAGLSDRQLLGHLSTCKCLQL